MKPYLAVFVSIFVAELGDKTQLATLLFASDPAVSRVGIFLAAAAALIASTALAVLMGAGLGNVIAPGVLKTVAGIAFIAIGAWMLVAR
jgi:putative Ca2+/H+ antiporter (TMEM165/GDT1 family)